MPTPKSHRRGCEEKTRRGILSEKSLSFHGRIPATTTNTNMAGVQLRRPSTVPDLLISARANHVVLSSPEERPKLMKLLLNVTIMGSLGAVQVVMTSESAVRDLIAAALRQYDKEGRRPKLPTTDPAGFDLHYSQFSLESLGREEKLMTLGSRNFFLCPAKLVVDSGSSVGFGTESSTSVTCSKQAEKVSKISIPWLKFMDFLL